MFNMKYKGVFENEDDLKQENEVDHATMFQEPDSLKHFFVSCFFIFFIFFYYSVTYIDFNYIDSSFFEYTKI